MAAKAAQAEAEARTMSTPYALRGDVGGSSTRGAAPLTLAEGGKAMTRDRGTEALMDTVPLQGRVAGAGRAAEAGTAEVQAPARDGGVEALARQAQAAQPSVCTADAAQQQPPWHRLVAQSKGEAQGSPGEKVAQEPVPGWQARQPREAAAGEQQEPDRQAPEEQVALEEQGAPGAAAKEGGGVGAANVVGAATTVPLR